MRPEPKTAHNWAIVLAGGEGGQQMRSLIQCWLGYPRPKQYCSRAVLATEQTLVFPMDGIHWSDWGSPTRIIERLQRTGKVPSFPMSCM